MQSRIRIASPCSASWDRMEGDVRIRHCAQCDLDVYNFSAMTEVEIAQLRSAHTGRICGRLYRRADGTVLTQDCPVGARLVRISHVAGAALSVAVGLSAAVAQVAPPAPANSAQETQTQGSYAEVTVVVTDSNGAAIANASVSLLNRATQIKTESRTDSEGKARFGNVVPTFYTLTVESNGFQSQQLPLEVTARQVIETKVELDVGWAAEMGVIVDPSDVEVQTIDASLIDFSQIKTNTPGTARRPSLLRRLISKLGL